MNTLVAPDQHWTIWAILLAAAAFGIWSERTRWGGRISGCVVTMGVTFALTNLYVLPSGVGADGEQIAIAAYDTTWGYLVPLAIPLLLFRADVRRILREAGPTLGAYAIGVLGTVIGTVIAFHVVPLGEHGWQLAAIFAATYIGGTMNYSAAAASVELESGGLLTAGLAADNLVMALYFLVLFALPGMRWIASRYPSRPALDEAMAATVHPPADSGSSETASDSMPSVLTTATALALSAAICAAGFGLAKVIGWKAGGVLALTAIVVVLATTLPRQMARLEGSDRLGMFLMQIFFAVVGASANLVVVFEYGPMLFVFALLILAIHLAFLLLAGRFFRFDLRELVIASNANLGGPTTAAAMAASRRWSPLVMPAILCGTLGYAFATFAGVALGRWLG